MPSPADKVIAELDTLPDPMADLSPADRVLAEQGLYFDPGPVAPRQAYHYDEANDTGLAGEVYGRFVRDAAGAAASGAGLEQSPSVAAGTADVPAFARLAICDNGLAPETPFTWPM